MQQLLDAVRSTGATQPVIAGGTDYARVLDEWLAHMPVDPAGQLAASEHTYGKLAPCVGACRTAIANVAAVKPVVVGELGETDCRHGYIDKFMPWADRRGISYIGWTWNATSSAEGGWTCKGGPSLIENFNGKPTRFGVGFRNHLRKLARSADEFRRPAGGSGRSGDPLLRQGRPRALERHDPPGEISLRHFELSGRGSPSSERAKPAHRASPGGRRGRSSRTRGP